MKNSSKAKFSPFMMGIVLLGGLFLLLSQSIAQTSAKPAEIQGNLSMAQVERCGVIENGDFENGFPPWTATGQWEIVSGRNGNGLAISSPFVQQHVIAEANQAFVLTGYYRTEGEFGGNWTGIGIDYLNGTSEIDEASFRITTLAADFVQFEISGTTPTNTDNLSIWLYSNGNVTLVVDDIELQWADCDTTPPPTPTPISPTITPIPTVSPTATPSPTLPPTPEPPIDLISEMIYDDSVSPDWLLGHWGVVSRNPLAKEPVLEGENSLEISLANSFSSLFFETKEAIPAADLHSVNFALTTVGTEVQTFELELFNRVFQPLNTQTVVASEGEWKQIELVYSDLPVGEDIKYIVITNSASSAPFYIDNLYIEKVEVAPPTFAELIYMPFIRR